MKIISVYKYDMEVVAVNIDGHNIHIKTVSELEKLLQKYPDAKLIFKKQEGKNDGNGNE